MREGGPSSRFSLCFQQHNLLCQHREQRLLGGERPVWLAARLAVLGAQLSALIAYWTVQPRE